MDKDEDVKMMFFPVKITYTETLDQIKTLTALSLEFDKRLEKLLKKFNAKLKKIDDL